MAGSETHGADGLERRRRLAAAGFITLLLLSVFWPSPVVSANRLWLNHDLDVDQLSFLGRQAPSWDVVFWCIAGLFTIALLASGKWNRDDFVEPFRRLRLLRVPLPRRFGLAALIWSSLVALTWLLLDAPLVRIAERLQSDATEDVIRIFNRLGGGMNPALVVGFFLVAGVAYRHRSWIDSALAMALSGLAAGLLAQVLKKAIGRSRPELWLGPFEFTRDAASAFPSGHTVGAFALAAAIAFTARSRVAGSLALLLAAGVGVSRILAFRHWPSDVLASALIGVAAAWIFSAGVSRLTRPGPVRP